MLKSGGPLTPTRRLVCVLAIGFAMVACGPNLPGGSATICNGISSDVGGCDRDLPSFVGTDCETIARQYGSELNRRVLAVINGPAVVENKSQAVRESDAMSLLTSLANARLRTIGEVAKCSAPQFLAAAEPQFSADLRAHAGQHLYDGAVVDYAAWKGELLRFLEIIDLNEGVSSHGPS